MNEVNVIIGIIFLGTVFFLYRRSKKRSDRRKRNAGSGSTGYESFRDSNNIKEQQK